MIFYDLFDVVFDTGLKGALLDRVFFFFAAIDIFSKQFGKHEVMNRSYNGGKTKFRVNFVEYFFLDSLFDDFDDDVGIL